jgi:hypothetical protein
MENICSETSQIKCNGVPSTSVKTLIEAALGERQHTEATALAWRGSYISLGSFAISCLSLMMSFLTFRRGKTAR